MSGEPMDVVPDDDIDIETLQAQIDLSMSFAHELVASWMKPADRATLGSSSADTQKLMEEQMRRPPRLGVGAPIPESSNSLRETSRLKYQLQGKGKKREREEVERPVNSRGQSDNDEEESRVSSIRKKTKADTFAVGTGKKKKNKSQDQPATVLPIQSAIQSLLVSKSKFDAASDQTHIIPTESPTVPEEHTALHTKKKKKLKNGTSVDHVESELKMQGSLSHKPHQNLATQSATPSPMDIMLPSSPMSSHKSFGKQSSNGAADSRVSATDDTSSTTISQTSQSPLLTHSSPSNLLPPQLRGSLPDHEDLMTGDNTSLKSKKKRKRRKKKKMQGDGQAHNN